MKPKLTTFLLLAFFHVSLLSYAAEIPQKTLNHVESATFELLVNKRLVGTGWFASPNGMGITAAHLLRGAKQIEVNTDGTILHAKLITIDNAFDLALIMVERHGGFFPYLTMAEKAPARGETIYTYGSVLYRHGIHLTGQVASQQTTFEWNEPNQCYTEVTPVSAMTPKGLSGAAWINSDGRVVGLQSGMITWNNALMGIAFMSPKTAIQSLLVSKKTGMTASLGLQIVEPWEGTSVSPTKTVEGLRVTKVLNGGPADTAGIKVGNIIKSVNGTDVNYRDRLIREIRATPSGKTLTLNIERPSPETIVLQPQACGSF